MSDDVVEDRSRDHQRRRGDRAIAVVIVTGVDARGRQRRHKEKKKTHTFELGTLTWVRVVPSSGNLHRCRMVRDHQRRAIAVVVVTGVDVVVAVKSWGLNGSSMYLMGEIDTINVAWVVAKSSSSSGVSTT